MYSLIKLLKFQLKIAGKKTRQGRVKFSETGTKFTPKNRNLREFIFEKKRKQKLRKSQHRPSTLNRENTKKKKFIYMSKKGREQKSRQKIREGAKIG